MGRKARLKWERRCGQKWRSVRSSTRKARRLGGLLRHALSGAGGASTAPAILEAALTCQDDNWMDWK